jgi:putative pyruvate formate lyase activating enzyme
MMSVQDARIIVRILVLPSHVECCHKPAIELLSQFKDRVWVSVLDQYIPEHEAHLDPKLNRRPTREEISEVESLVERHGLRNIASGCEGFWTE